MERLTKVSAMVVVGLLMAGLGAVEAAPNNWQGVTTNWNESINWSLGWVPQAGDDVVIPPTATKPTLNAATSIGTLTIQSGGKLTCIATGDLTVTGNVSCAGTLTLNTNTFTCGGSADFTGGTLTYSAYSTFVMNGASGINTLTLPNNTAVFNLSFTGAGTFNFGNPDLTVKGDWTQTAGTVNAPSGTLTFDSTAGGRNNSYIHTAGGTFNHNNGTIVVRTANTFLNTIVAPPENFYNLTLNAAGPAYGIGSASSGTIIVNGAMTFTVGTINGGTFEAKGSISASAFSGAGNGTLLIDGAGDQSFTVANGGGLPGIILSNALTTISFAGTNANMSTLALYAGTFNAPSGTLEFNSYVPCFVHTAAGGTFNHNNGTVLFAQYGGSVTMTRTDDFYNVILNYIYDTSGYITFPAGNLFVVNGTLTLTKGKLAGGPIVAKGPINLSSAFSGGTGAITLSGTNDQTLSLLNGTNNWPTGAFVVDKAGGTATATGTTWVIAGAAVITNGTLALGCPTVFSNTVTLSSGGTLVIDGYSVTTNKAVTLNPGSTVSYIGGDSPVTVQNWAYRKLTINAPDKQLNWTAGVTTTVSEAFTVQGPQPRHFVTLRSTAPGTPWYINTTGATTDVSRVDVQDSVSTLPIKASMSLDSGRNVNWLFTGNGTVVIVH